MVKAVYGWGDAVRLGRWTCLFVTVADAQTRSAEIQVQGTYGTGTVLLIGQTVVVEPRPRVYALLFPLNADPSHIAVLVKDSETGKMIASQVLENPAGFTPAGHVPVKLLGASDTLIGIGGDVGDALLLQAQFSRANLVSGILNSSKLPDNAIGYEGISLLVLAAADFRELDALQRHAMVDWVNAGGNLVVIPGAQPLPQNDPLQDKLPCDVGPNRTVLVPNAATTQPSPLNGRQLQPRAGAQEIQLPPNFADLGCTGFTCRQGLGRITLLNADVAPLKFAANADAIAFWRAVFTGMAQVQNPQAITAIEVSDEQEDVMPVGPTMADNIGRGQRETLAIRHLLDAMNASDSHSPHPWMPLTPYLLGIFAILGPLDGAMFIALRAHARHWTTTLGWLGLVVCVVVYFIHRPASAAEQIHHFRLIDQVEDHVVATTDLMAIESNRADEFAPTLDPNEWWEPANQSAANFGVNRYLDFNFREDRKGCRPDVLNLRADEPQSLRGELIAGGPAILSASLAIHEDASGHTMVSGEITNRSTLPMRDIQIAANGGIVRVDGVVAPGSAVEVNEILTKQSVVFDELPADAFDAAPDRNDRIAALLKSGLFACVYWQMGDESDFSDRQICRAVAAINK